MVARIFKTSKTAMQSGTGNANQWFLEFEKNDHKPIDQVMSWIGSSDTTSQIKLKFETRMRQFNTLKAIISCILLKSAQKKR